MKHHGRYGGHTGRNTAKTIVHEALTAVYLSYGSHTSQKMSKRSVPGAVQAKPEAKIWRRSVFELSDPYFLFDCHYITGSNSHRYEATGWESQHYDTVKAVADIFRISMKDTRFFQKFNRIFLKL